MWPYICRRYLDIQRNCFPSIHDQGCSQDRINKKSDLPKWLRASRKVKNKENEEKKPRAYNNLYRAKMLLFNYFGIVENKHKIIFRHQLMVIHSFSSGFVFPVIDEMNNPAFESNGSVSDADAITPTDNRETSLTGVNFTNILKVGICSTVFCACSLGLKFFLQKEIGS